MKKTTYPKRTELACELCLYFYKVDKERHCKLKKCCCIEERRAAGYTGNGIKHATMDFIEKTED